jgi:hypothetical protein
MTQEELDELKESLINKTPTDLYELLKKIMPVYSFGIPNDYIPIEQQSTIIENPFDGDDFELS